MSYFAEKKLAHFYNIWGNIPQYSVHFVCVNSHQYIVHKLVESKHLAGMSFSIAFICDLLHVYIAEK